MAESDIPRISSTEPIWKQELKAQQAFEKGLIQQAEEAQEDFQQWAEQGFNGVPTRRFRNLKEQKETHAKVKAVEKKGEADDQDKIEKKEKVEETALSFQRKNPELRARTLQLLLQEISAKDTAETLLAKVLRFYPDPFLADEALLFLYEVTRGLLQEKVSQSSSLLQKNYEREIKAGRNISSHAREFSTQGLGDPNALRNLYRDVTGNPRDAYTLFDELFSQFSFAKMKPVAQFLLHSLGADLKAKGPSIAKVELAKIVEDIRIIQAILGVFLFFQSRSSLMGRLFKQYQLAVPFKLHFESLSREFLKLLQERYLSADRIFQMGRNLGLLEDEIAQIIVYTQVRDAIRQVAPRLYKSNQHKEDLLEALIEALEELEEEGDEEEEEES